MKDSSKLLSVIVPSYNMEKYLPKCLGSLIIDDKELLQRLDVIVVNDGSKDRTSEIAHGYEAKYPGVFCVIDKSNGNYGSCVNAAIKVAQGRYVKILDADDSYDTLAFERYLAVLSEMPDDVDMVMNDFVQVDELDHDQGAVSYDLPEGKSLPVEELVTHRCSMAMHAVAHRTESIRRIGYTQLEGMSYTDTEWFYLPVAFARSVRYVHLPVYRYLVGRVGQTMEQTTWVKNCWMMDKIFGRMLDQYECVDKRASNAYLVAQLRRMFMIVFNLHLDGSGRMRSPAYFVELRQLVAEHPVLLPFVRELLLFASMPFRFHYAEFLMKYPLFAKPVLSLVRWWWWCRHVVALRFMCKRAEPCPEA